MFGAFRPSTSLSGGLLWKIPWRLSAPQKLRHRRRLRRVDNIVSILDNALKRQATSITSQQPTSPTASSRHPSPSSGASAADLATTKEGQRLLASEANAAQESRRHGRGPRHGEMVPESAAASDMIADAPILQRPSGVLLGDQARAQGTIKKLERWKAEMPTEAEMLAKNKYTIFDRKVRGYRKGIHKLPKWTRVSQRLNPPGF